MTQRKRLGTTLVETLVILGALVVLLVVTLPSIARSAAAGRVMSSAQNLRTLGVAHAVYETDWNGRQLTFVDDAIAAYGNAGNAFANYRDERGQAHPPVVLGWGRLDRDDPRRVQWFAYRTGSNCANALLTLPVVFTGAGCSPGLAYFGAFRIMNAAQFNGYLGGRFYDETFYTPEDPVVFDAVDAGGCFDAPDEYCVFAEMCDANGSIPAWSSYCLSPAAMLNPRVMSHDDPAHPLYNGFQDPWELPDGFRSPPVFQALYPHLKTRVLEHNWIRGAPPPPRCNPGFDPGSYGKDCCEPFYFNHSLTSAPLTLFYDGHVAPIVVADAMADDARVREQQGNDNWGLWSKDTPWGADGYLEEYGYDQADTSFHILTTDGLLGRDIIEPAGPRPRAHSRPRPDAKRPPPRRPAPFGSTTGARITPLE